MLTLPRPQVIEYCDLGNLSTALKNNIFLIPNPALAAAAGAGDSNAAALSPELAADGRSRTPMKVRPAGGTGRTRKQ